MASIISDQVDAVCGGRNRRDPIGGEIAAVVTHAQELSMHLSLCEVSDAFAVSTFKAAQTAASRLLGPSSMSPLSSPTRRFRKENHLVFSSHLR